MNLTKSSNPVLGQNVFAKAAYGGYEVSEQMTIKGTVNKTIITLLLLIASASFTWKMAYTAVDPMALLPYMGVGAIGGFITALVVALRPKAAPIGTPIYAILEGLFLGGVSAFFAQKYGGIVFQAVSLTMLVLFSMLFMYRTGMIKVTQKFRMGVMAATGGIALFFLMSFILRMFGVNMGFMHGGLIGIGISLFIIVIAALNLVLDFDFIERSAAAGAPKYMEWYGAFGLMVTLVWLYLEMLRLLAMLAGRD